MTMPMRRLSETQRLLSRLTQLTISDALHSLTVASKSLTTFSPDVPKHSYLSPEQTHIADDLISIFKDKPFSSNSPDLSRFVPVLTHKLVESVLTRFKSWETASSFFAWTSKQPGYKHNCYTYNAMASILLGVRQNAALSALASDLVESNCPITPGGLGYLLRCLGGLRMVNEADGLFDRVKRNGLCVPNEYSYACLLEVISKSGSVDLIDSRLKEMTSSGFKMTKYSATPLLQAYCNAGEFEKALTVFNDMFEKGLADDRIFTILIVSFSKCGKVDETLEFLGKMEDANLRLSEKTFYVLINGFVKQWRVDEAFRLFGKMRESGLRVDVALFDVLIGGLSRNKDIEKALGLYGDMKSLPIRPDARIIAKLVDCCPSERDIIRLLEEENQQHVKDPHEVALLYQSVLSYLINSGSNAKARTLLRMMIGDEASSSVLEVNRLLKISPLQMTPCFIIVIDGLLATGNLDTGLEIFKDMIRVGSKPDQTIRNNPIDAHRPWIKYSALFVDQLCKNGYTIEAYSLVDEMALKGLVPSMATYDLLISGLCTVEKPDEATRLFDDMASKGFYPNKTNFMALIECLCRNGKPEAALAYLSTMEEREMSPDGSVCTALLSAFLSDSNLLSAFYVLKKIAERRCIHGQLARSHSLIRDAVVKILADEGISPSVKALIEDGSLETLNYCDIGSDAPLC